MRALYAIEFLKAYLPGASFYRLANIWRNISNDRNARNKSSVFSEVLLTDVH